MNNNLERPMRQNVSCCWCDAPARHVLVTLDTRRAHLGKVIQQDPACVQHSHEYRHSYDTVMGAKVIVRHRMIVQQDDSGTCLVHFLPK